ncbi:ABC transporter G family member 40 [Forsythia ovata]|uniref:ABC transporter G family member 40 n=1 Tax=Forsythia ovata TaxID=205694 RepID=A0ABD1QDW8_9LAMI
MALLLGPPSSEKTTLMLALAGKLDPALKAAATKGDEANVVTDYYLKLAPETYDLFDDIILLSDGQIIYQGPREQVLEFFESMGFRCPDRKGVADFLQEVTSKKDQQQYWAKDGPYRFITVDEFAEAFQSFHLGRKVGDELSVPFDKSKGHPAALTTEKYGLRTKELLKACADRELLLMKRNSFVYFFKLFQA